MLYSWLNGSGVYIQIPATFKCPSLLITVTADLFVLFIFIFYKSTSLYIYIYISHSSKYGISYCFDVYSLFWSHCFQTLAIVLYFSYLRYGHQCYVITIVDVHHWKYDDGHHGSICLFTTLKYHWFLISIDLYFTAFLFRCGYYW